MAENFREKITSKTFLVFLGIFVIGLFLRLYALDKYPISFHSQEALLGWRAKSLLVTGKDETGRPLPLIFSSLEGYQLPLATYMVLPSVKAFGLNEFGVRFPFAFLGVLSLLAFYGIVLSLFKDKKMSLWAAFIFATSPGIIFLSRIASPPNLSLSFFLLGFFCLLWGAKKRFFLIGAFIFLLGSLYAAKMVWVFLLPFLLLYWIFTRKKEIGFLIIILAFACLPLLFSYSASPQAKLDLVHSDFNLFSEVTILNGINMMRGEDIAAGYPFLGRIFYTKLFYLEKIFENFLRHFNPRFYFAAGDGHPLHGLTNFGPIFLVFLPLSLLGIKWITSKERKKLFFLLFWFILGIIPSVFVIPSPNQEKVLFVLPVLIILAAYALSRLNLRPVLLFLLFLLFNFAVVFYDGLIKEPFRNLGKWQYSYKELSLFLGDQLKNYEKIFLTDAYGSDPGPAYLFYTDFPPQKFLEKDALVFSYRNYISKIGNITINQQNQWMPQKSALYIIAPSEEKIMERFGLQKTEVLPVKVIRDPDGKTAFMAFTIFPHEVKNEK